LDEEFTHDLPEKQSLEIQDLLVNIAKKEGTIQAFETYVLSRYTNALRIRYGFESPPPLPLKLMGAGLNSLMSCM
jgi:hypothetical protein